MRNIYQPVFYPGKIVVNCINSIPKNFEIFIYYTT